MYIFDDIHGDESENHSPICFCDECDSFYEEYEDFYDE
jgi:hypothetical protein